MDSERFRKVEITSTDDLWNWLERHQAQEASIWLVTWKAEHRECYVSRDEVLDALIAFGWVDGRRMKLDDNRTMLLLSPRKQQEWAQTYKDRADRLREEGRMQASGEAAIERAKKAGLWNATKAVDALHEPADLVAELQKAKAYDWWSQGAPSYRRNILRWMDSAKRAETRSKRMSITVDHAKRHEKVPNY